MTLKKLMSGTALAFLLTAGIAAAQTSTSTDTSASTTDTLNTSANSSAVGTPNTGDGGDTAMNMAILGTSAAVAVGGAALLRRRSF
jgi:hypothetical protein